jgi:hypothetical protein
VGVSPELGIVATSTPVRLAGSQSPRGDGVHRQRGLGGVMETIIERPAGLDVH